MAAAAIKFQLVTTVTGHPETINQAVALAPSVTNNQALAIVLLAVAVTSVAHPATQYLSGALAYLKDSTVRLALTLAGNTAVA